jgi:hypothetical protein
MSVYNDILNEVKRTGILDLMEYRKLPIKEIDNLNEEIRYWCTYGNGELDKIANEKKTNKL